MTITPDDLPGGEASQVVCGCLGEVFRFVIAGPEVRAVCPACGATAGRWPAATAGPPPAAASPVLHAGYLDTGEPAGPGPADPAITEYFGGPPPLPACSPAACDACLDGGPYDGQITFTLGADPFIIRGVGTYRRTGEQRDGRDVYTWTPAPGSR